MTVRTLWSIYLLLLGPTLPLWASHISCINEDGKPVDWYILYKFPKHMSYDVARTGLEYMFMDSVTPAWKLSKYFINMTESALGQTLQQLYQTYEAKNSVAYVMYNDGPPNKMNYSWTHGHSKGFLLLEESQGFWVIHSIPEFPPFPEDGFSYPSTGKSYGQAVICLTFPYDQFAEIDRQLLYYNPNVYNCSIPKPFQGELFYVQILCAGSQLPPAPWNQSLVKLQSAKAETFFSFAKTKCDHEDIYVAWMAQKLQTDFLVESWQRKGHQLFSNCSLPYHIYNINRIQTPWNTSFSSYYDHSKWCVSIRPEDQWTCIGDLNYAAQQSKRSGGFVCTQNRYIYTAFRSLVLHYYDCRELHESIYGSHSIVF
ncbi:deoxyribonuclease-2-beta [Rhineura floridana]|uniref:deoxyribonuclease-2-beta n=1 Tax=Rhineura floridana TaxID=261503 RepID=UPI002AC828DD|nr:deoxyribonuclease-2-beta [Rhineura floridana]